MSGCWLVEIPTLVLPKISKPQTQLKSSFFCFCTNEVGPARTLAKWQVVNGDDAIENRKNTYTSLKILNK